MWYRQVPFNGAKRDRPEVITRCRAATTLEGVRLDSILTLLGDEEVDAVEGVSEHKCACRGVEWIRT